MPREAADRGTEKEARERRQDVTGGSSRSPTERGEGRTDGDRRSKPAKQSNGATRDEQGNKEGS